MIKYPQKTLGGIEMSKKPAVNWEETVEKFRISGKAQRQFCKENNLALSTFCKKLSNQSLSEKNPIWVATEMPSSKSQIEIEIGKCKIVITEYNKALLLDLIEGISKLC